MQEDKRRHRKGRGKDSTSSRNKNRRVLYCLRSRCVLDLDLVVKQLQTCNLMSNKIITIL